MPHLFVGTAEQNSMSTKVNEDQKALLEHAFTLCSTPNDVEMTRLATTAGLEQPEVHSWFVRKRKRDKKKCQKAKKKKKVSVGATTSTTTAVAATVTTKYLHEEVALTTASLAQDQNNSELYYRRGGALISLGYPKLVGKVIDRQAWDDGIRDLERAHSLRYGGGILL